MGSTESLTLIIPLSLKHLTTSTMASTSLTWDKNLFPSPSPFEAPFTSPAISVNSYVVGIVRNGWYISVNLSILSSGTITIPTLGSIVAKG